MLRNHDTAPCDRWNLVALTATQWLDNDTRPTTTTMTADVAELRRAARDGAVIWDVRPRAPNGRGRGARGLSLGGIDWVVEDAALGRLASVAIIARVLRRIGILPGCRVVVYSDRAAEGFLALRALRSVGVDAASVFVERRQRPVRARRPARRPAISPSRRLASFWVAQARNHPVRALRNEVVSRT